VDLSELPNPRTAGLPAPAHQTGDTFISPRAGSAAHPVQAAFRTLGIEAAALLGVFPIAVVTAALLQPFSPRLIRLLAIEDLDAKVLTAV